MSNLCSSTVRNLYTALLIATVSGTPLLASADHRGQPEPGDNRHEDQQTALSDNSSPAAVSGTPLPALADGRGQLEPGDNRHEDRQMGTSNKSSHEGHPSKGIKQVIIPLEDRFNPFSITVRVGTTVRWVNTDADDHTVVSDDEFNTVGNKFMGINHTILGTENAVDPNPDTFSLRFNRSGVFVYHCRFHSHVETFDDDSKQPVAPGPGADTSNPMASGISCSTNPTSPGFCGIIPNTPPGNFGTPMMGVITVVPGPVPDHS